MLIDDVISRVKRNFRVNKNIFKDKEFQKIIHARWKKRKIIIGW